MQDDSTALHNMAGDRDATSQASETVMDPTLDPAVEPGAPYPPAVSDQEAIEATQDLGAFSAPKPPPHVDVDLAVPYIHQLWDTPDAFDGHWACGATCSTMVLAYYGLLEPHPITVKVPFSHTSKYGWYLSNAFDHNGKTLSATADSPSGMTPGIYGTVLDNVSGIGWVAVWNLHQKGIKPLMDIFLPGIGNKATIVAPTPPDQIHPDQIKKTLDSGHPVIMAGLPFGYHHIMVVRGYYQDQGGIHWIMNDPYSYRTRGKTYDGGDVVYEWDEIKPRWAVLFSGKTVPKQNP